MLLLSTSIKNPFGTTNYLKGTAGILNPQTNPTKSHLTNTFFRCTFSFKHNRNIEKNDVESS